MCIEVPAAQIYLDVCVIGLDKCALEKSKYVEANNRRFMNKQILNAIMDRVRFRNKFLKN